MKETTNDEQQTALKLLVVLSKSFKSVMDVAVKDIKSYGLSSTEFGILEVLYAKGRIPIQQIGDRVLITSGTMTYNIDKLENKGYLKRVPCSHDRRVTYAEITDVGRKLFDDIFPQHAQRIETVMNSLTLEEQKQAIELLKVLGKGAAGK
ncbi:MarR family winged helix-turn-helix transcriptional regulator [Paenibacillus sp. NPDC058174]|uniref:MarR family winged helix-turn-helix transcriptional regulator n=1 Tax=Paenibacillus sp. NPDC058174 TaxID=3346366 RepID=UPI0036DA7A20